MFLVGGEYWAWDGSVGLGPLFYLHLLLYHKNFTAAMLPFAA